MVHSSLIFRRRLPERGSESFRDFSISSFQWSIPLSSFAVVSLSVAASLLETFPYHPFNGPFLSHLSGFHGQYPSISSSRAFPLHILWSSRLSWPVSFHFFLQGVSPPYSLIFPAFMASILPFLPPGRFPSILSDLPGYHGQYPSISSSRAFPLHILWSSQLSWPVSFYFFLQGVSPPYSFWQLLWGYYFPTFSYLFFTRPNHSNLLIIGSTFVSSNISSIIHLGHVASMEFSVLMWTRSFV